MTPEHFRKSPNWLLGLTILLGFLAVGEGLSRISPVPLPGSVAGLMLLTIALSAGVVRLQWVEAAADGLLDNMGLFFVPAGVGVMVYFDLIAREFVPIAASVLVSTLLVLTVTGHAAQIAERLWRRFHPKRMIRHD